MFGVMGGRNRMVVGGAVGLSLFALSCGDDESGSDKRDDLELITKVLATNAQVALAAYDDSVSTAQALKAAISDLVASPSETTLAAAKKAWLVAREPYGQTEVFRFRASPIDDTNYDPADGEDGPEGEINAWPLGEAVIDYVTTGDDFGADQVGVSSHETGVKDPIPTNNIINSTDIEITAELLSKTASAEDEHDVIAGYHAIEFLLWGQDLNADGSADTLSGRDATPGQRPHTDFLATADCTSGAQKSDAALCERRGLYLEVAVDKLIADLEGVRDGWKPGADYFEAFTKPRDAAEGKKRLLEILTGMGTLSEGELAGERMQIALSANSQEDEHSCFSDNTHRDIVTDAQGVLNVFRGDYPGYDSSLDGKVDETGRAVNGYGLDEYLSEVGLSELASEVATALANTEKAYQSIDALARKGTPVDIMIQDPGAAAAKPMRDTIVALNAQAQEIVRIAEELELGSADDVVDPEASACDTTDPTTEC